MSLVTVRARGSEALAGWTVLVGVVLGSALTVAYTARFLWGTFATKPGVEPSGLGRIPAGFLAAPVLLRRSVPARGLPGRTGDHAALAVRRPVPGPQPGGLALWHGPNLALAAPWSRWRLGLLMFWQRRAVRRHPVRAVPGWSAERGYFGLVRWVDRAAVEVTGFTQRGSVTAYLSVILMVVVLLPGSALLAAGLGPVDLVGWDNVGQPVVAAIVVVAAVLTTRARRRLKAVVMVGVTGYGTAMLFLLHGAPDLALTQVLVETVSLVVFVLVLRRLPEYFTDRLLTPRRYWRIALGVVVAATVAGVMVVDHRCPHRHAGLGGLPCARRWPSAAAATSST